jgi:hypothetical protein
VCALTPGTSIPGEPNGMPPTARPRTPLGRVERARFMSPIVMHRDPGCGCCAKWAAQVQQQLGRQVRVVDDPLPSPRWGREERGLLLRTLAHRPEHRLEFTDALVPASAATPIVMHRDPGCGCCAKWAAQVQQQLGRQVKNLLGRSSRLLAGGGRNEAYY